MAEEDASGLGDTLGCLAVVGAPALLMLFGGFAAAGARIPERLQACTQNFSGGLLISAVAGELFPLMTAEGTSVIGLVCGFLLALMFMFGLDYLTGEDEDDDTGARSVALQTPAQTPLLPAQIAEDEKKMAVFKKDAPLLLKGIEQLDRAVKEAIAKDGSREEIDETLHSLMYRTDRARRQLKDEPLDARNLVRMGEHVQELRENYAAVVDTSAACRAGKALDAFEKTLEHIHNHSERSKFRRWKPEPPPMKGKPLKEAIPWALVLTVSVDAAVDGFLIGMAFAAAESAGWCMSIATSIEMGFLGLSFMATLRNSTRSVWKLTTLAVLPPLILLLCGLLGQVAGAQFRDDTFWFTGFIAFAVVALLFLVTQELLTEAREVAGDDLVVNSVLFLGLLAGILLERVVG